MLRCEEGIEAGHEIAQVTEALRHISGEAGLLRYLASLQEAPSSPHFKVSPPPLATAAVAAHPPLFIRNKT